MPAHHMSATEMAERHTLRKISWRIIPFLLICYMMAIIDRGNVGMASLQMNADLGLTAQAFGFGSSLFFISNFACEVPSSLALKRFGARKWIARIMLTWGAVTLLTAWITSANMFYLARFLLGAAEAGFFPGVLLYLTYWIPRQYRGWTGAIFMAGIPVSNVIGSPISAALLQMDGTLGLRGWHWLFILEGVTTISLGLACLVWLVDKPKEAKWLLPAENAWLEEKFAFETKAVKQVAPETHWKTMLNRHILCLALVDASSTGASVTLAVWQPQLLKSLGLTVSQTGILNAIPYALGVVAMIFWGRRSDRRKERFWHTVIPIGLIAAGSVAICFSHSLYTIMIGLSCVMVGAYSEKPTFWALASSVLSNRVAAVGLATINAVSILVGGGLMVSVYGWIKQATGSYALSMLPFAGLAAVSIVALMFVHRGTTPDSAYVSSQAAEA
ncbi:MFS transporter [Caballeronia insecticola]|nr:MFS transporter [Caballeronia insecticola]